MKEVVGFILYNLEGKILLQHRTDDAPTDASKWTIFGGGVKKGEDSLTAVKRESLEELEYMLGSPQLVYKKQLGNELVYIYIEVYDSKQELVLHEGRGMGWYSYEELNNLDLADYNLEILLNVQNELNRGK